MCSPAAFFSHANTFPREGNMSKYLGHFVGVAVIVTVLLWAQNHVSFYSKLTA
jgi:hypothetical protein